MENKIIFRFELSAEEMMALRVVLGAISDTKFYELLKDCDVNHLDVDRQSLLKVTNTLYSDTTIAYNILCDD